MASEVARLREQIEAECQSLQMIRLFTPSASHEIISAKYRILDKHHQQLASIVGEQEATEISVNIYNVTMEKLVAPGKRKNIEREDPPEPPELPEGYMALGKPRPLIFAGDERWAVLAESTDIGLLIYENRRCVAFLIPEECMTLLYTLMEHAQGLFDLAKEPYLSSSLHVAGLERVRTWLNKHHLS